MLFPFVSNVTVGFVLSILSISRLQFEVFPNLSFVYAVYLPFAVISFIWALPYVVPSQEYVTPPLCSSVPTTFNVTLLFV